MNSFVTFGRETGSPYTTANFINIFSTSTGSWIGTGSTMVTDPTRRDMTIASDPSSGGQIYFIGGDAGQTGTGRSNALDIYNIRSSVVSETSVPLPGPQNLQGGAAAWLPNRNSMLIVGGIRDNTDTNFVYLYTPGSASTAYSASTSPGSYNSNNANGNSGDTSTSGGSNTGYSSGSNSGSSSGWAAQATNGYFPSLRTAHCVASNEDGSVVGVFGGFVNRSSTSDHSIYFLDTRTWTWTMSSSNTVRGRSYSACAMTGNQFIVWGGFYSNPTSTPNNLPSVEESTLVYSRSEQNWVNTYIPQSTSSSGSGSGSYPGSEDRGTGNGGDLSHPSGKSFGLVLAIAAVGAILALLITVGAIMVIRKRNQRRRNDAARNSHIPKNGDRQLSSSSTASSLTNPTGGRKKSLTGVWDQKSPLALENGLHGQTAITVTGHDDNICQSSSGFIDSNPPVPSYNSWEYTTPVTRREDVTSPSMGTVAYTETTIVTVAPPPRISTSKSGPRVAPQISPMSASKKHVIRGPADAEQLAYQHQQRQKNHKQHQQQQQQQQQNLEQEFEDKSQGAFFPISVEREYR
ncbi:hypothetical protein BGZ52_008001 [Haplosporangium bisporale]|nr:hypothetical protein BGZ52_008001 [Haplosporangium bisporale]